MDHERENCQPSWVRSAFGLVLFALAMFVVFLLLAEHRAHLILGTWLIWLLALGCIAAHVFLGRHGGHGDRRSSTGDKS
ncbi:MAG: DUF2933 domain-containing protein [Alphaproteobacteria bacterium]|nr:DUF2933 domain-containing protein [Alphaproteobacteria bacterium]